MAFVLVCAALVGFQTSSISVHQVQHSVKALFHSPGQDSQHVEQNGCDFCLALGMPMQPHSTEPHFIPIDTIERLERLPVVRVVVASQYHLPEARAPPFCS